LLRPYYPALLLTTRLGPGVPLRNIERLHHATVGEGGSAPTVARALGPLDAALRNLQRDGLAAHMQHPVAQPQLYAVRTGLAAIEKQSR